jgi:hypothetical protein
LTVPDFAVVFGFETRPFESLLLKFQGGGKLPDPRLIFLRTENCQSPNSILETKPISESIIGVQRENLSMGSGAEGLSWSAFDL